VKQTSVQLETTAMSMACSTLEVLAGTERPDGGACMDRYGISPEQWAGSSATPGPRSASRAREGLAGDRAQHPQRVPAATLPLDMYDHPAASAAGQASSWRDKYDAEPGWTERRLRAASLSDVTAIEAGWCVPPREGTGA
jgi:hypothetical protein